MKAVEKFKLAVCQKKKEIELGLHMFRFQNEAVRLQERMTTLQDELTGTEYGANLQESQSLLKLHKDSVFTMLTLNAQLAVLEALKNQVMSLDHMETEVRNIKEFVM